MMRSSDILVLGLGQAERGDDGVGPAVVDRVADVVADVEVASGPRDAAWILDAWREREGVVVVDAVRSGCAAGSVHIIDPRMGSFVDSASTSTHGLGLAAAVELGRALGDLPRRIALVGIEAGTFELAASMTDEVRAAIPRALTHVVDLVEQWRSERAVEDRRA